MANHQVRAAHREVHRAKRNGRSVQLDALVLACEWPILHRHAQCAALQMRIGTAEAQLAAREVLAGTLKGEASLSGMPLKCRAAVADF